MEPLKHECGIVMIRLRKPLEYYQQKYGTAMYGLNKLYLMMEKQHNRGQEGAGISCVKLAAKPGDEYMFREKALGSGAITEIFANVHSHSQAAKGYFIGELYMGHLRYSTTGKSGLSYVHPFLRRNNWRAKNLCLCGNFNMTNVDEVFAELAKTGQHPRIYSDTYIMLEQVGHRLDRESERLWAEAKEKGLEGYDITDYIEDNIRMENVLATSAPLWDGGYVVCGQTGSGEMFSMRDPWGIRPAFWYEDDEIFVVASERPCIQTALDVATDDVHELMPGQAVVVSKRGDVRFSQIIEPKENQRCSFERIYFSRGSDRDIYQERKSLGRQLVEPILKAIDGDVENTVFSFIPNTAEVAFYGMTDGFKDYLHEKKIKELVKALTPPQPSPTWEGAEELPSTSTSFCNIDNGNNNTPSPVGEGRGGVEDIIRSIISPQVRTEKVVLKDIKLRTFITEEAGRNDLAAHVYDITYGSVRPGIDNLVVIDDSIVRGTTLRESIIRILDRLHPKKIVIVSSAPQVRYPDYYGIDMSRLGEFIAFRAAIELLRDRGMAHVVYETYAQCKKMLETREGTTLANCVKAIYAPFTDEEISAKMVEMLRPEGVTTPIEIVFQTLDGLHCACPGHPGDWYFSGDYPTQGGLRLLCHAFIDYVEQVFNRQLNLNI